jgi:hypothetical protein
MVNRTLLTRGVCEPELDMTRVTARRWSGVLDRLISTIFRNSQAHHSIATPRRSVDREQQEYSADLG